MSRVSDSISVEKPAAASHEVLRDNISTSWRIRFSTWITNHLHKEDLKILFRCSFSAWLTMILVFITPSLRVLGNAAFFGAIVHFFFPPSGVVFLQFMVIGTMIVGIGLAWGWGLITMKAALAARPAIETQGALRSLEQNAIALTESTNTTLKYNAQSLLLDGAMLDTRVTAVYFSMGLIFIYFIARLQRKSPAFVLLSFFALIITDIFMTTGPLLSNFQSTLPKVLVLPSAVSMAISIVSAIFIFPRSTSYLALSDMQQLMKSLKVSLDTCQYGIQAYPVLPTIKDLRRNKADVFTIFNKLMGRFMLLGLDFSFGRWSAEDILSFKPLLRRLVITSNGLNNVYITRSKVVSLQEKQQNLRNISGMNSNLGAPSVARHHQKALYDFLEHMRHDGSEEFTKQSIFTLSNPSALLLNACRASLEALGESVETVNERRWLNKLTQESCLKQAAKHEATLEQLKQVKHEFSASMQQKLIEPYTELFDTSGQLILRGKNAAAMHTLVLSLNLSERLIRVASAIEALLQNAIRLEKKCTRSRLWLPPKFKNILAMKRKTNVSRTIKTNEIRSDPLTTDNPTKHAPSQRKGQLEGNEVEGSEELLRVQPPSKPKGSIVGRSIVALSQWISNETGMFALRMVLVSFALAIPAVIPSSAGFYYKEKGLWALIMGQTGLTIYMADLVFGVAGRFIFCVLGGVFGLVAWYIGSGTGTGNPYGLAAICGPCIGLMMFFRIHAPRSFVPMSVIGASTFILVVGYGYIDTHLEVYESPGYGVTVFWKRTLLVTVGYIGAVIVQCFPQAPSATQHVAEDISKALDATSKLYIQLINSWLSFPDDAEATTTLSFDTYHLGKVEHGQEFVAHKNAMQILKTLSALGLAIKSVAYEPSASPFTSTILGEAHTLVNQIVEVQSQLLGQMESLTPEFRIRFKNSTAALNEALIADVLAVFAMLSSSLRTGNPLPTLMPTPLLARSYGLAVWKGIDTLELNNLKDSCWPAYSLLTTSYITLLTLVDELVLVVKDAVGESHHVQGEVESGGWGFGYLKSHRTN